MRSGLLLWVKVATLFVRLQSPATLKKYIKAENLKVVEKLTDKYDYFK